MIAHQGVQKISKIISLGSFLIIKYAVERLDKNRHSQGKKIQKSYVKKLGWPVKKWPLLWYYYLFCLQELNKIT